MERSTAGEVRFASVVPHFTVPDVIRTAEHYRDMLGFEIASYWDGEQAHHDPARPAVFGIVQRDEVRVHLNLGDPSEGRRARADGPTTCTSTCPE